MSTVGPFQVDIPTVATETFHDIYIERRGDQYRWSFATKGGPYPLLRITARFLEMDPCSLVGVGSRVVGDGWGVQIVESDKEPDDWAVLTCEGHQTAEQVYELILTALG